MATSPLHRRTALCTHSTSRLGVMNACLAVYYTEDPSCEIIPPLRNRDRAGRRARFCLLSCNDSFCIASTILLLKVSREGRYNHGTHTSYRNFTSGDAALGGCYHCKYRTLLMVYHDS